MSDRLYPKNVMPVETGDKPPIGVHSVETTVGRFTFPVYRITDEEDGDTFLDPSVSQDEGGFVVAYRYGRRLTFSWSHVVYYFWTPPGQSWE